MSLKLSDIGVDLEDLVEQRGALEQEIRQRARAELAELDARRAVLLALLGTDPSERSAEESNRSPSR